MGTGRPVMPVEGGQDLELKNINKNIYQQQ
jgi:hypothetical protein